MFCFLCGREYDPSARTAVASVTDTESGETVNITYARVSTDPPLTFRLCPDCTRAAIFGNTFNAEGLAWDGDVAFEEEEEKDEDEGEWR